MGGFWETLDATWEGIVDGIVYGSMHTIPNELTWTKPTNRLNTIITLF